MGIFVSNESGRDIREIRFGSRMGIFEVVMFFFLSFFKVLVLKLRFFRTLCFGLLHSPVEFLINNVFLFYNENFNLCSKNILNLESKLLIISKETHINLTENILVTFINPTF